MMNSATGISPQEMCQGYLLFKERGIDSRFLKKNSYPQQNRYYVEHDEILTSILLEKWIGKESQAFVDKLIEVRETGNIGKSLDHLYGTIIPMLREGKFEQCDSLLAHLNLDRLDEYQLVGLLTSTAPWKKWIPARRALYMKVEKILSSRFPDEVADMLDGLQ